MTMTTDNTTDNTDMFCETCGEDIDRDCHGIERCPACDGPCVSCDDGGGAAQAVLNALSDRGEAEDYMWASLPLQYVGEEYWRDALKGLISRLEWDREAETEEELSEWIGEWASDCVPSSVSTQWEQFAELQLWLDRDAMGNAAASISEPAALAEMALWWAHYTAGSHVAEHLGRYFIRS